jgi:hypothetical protein
MFSFTFLNFVQEMDENGLILSLDMYGLGRRAVLDQLG